MQSSKKIHAWAQMQVPLLFNPLQNQNNIFDRADLTCYQTNFSYTSSGIFIHNTTLTYIQGLTKLGCGVPNTRQSCSLNIRHKWVKVSLILYSVLSSLHASPGNFSRDFCCLLFGLIF